VIQLVTGAVGEAVGAVGTFRNLKVLSTVWTGVGWTMEALSRRFVWAKFESKIRQTLKWNS
jgi:hypothetical protein